MSKVKWCGRALLHAPLYYTIATSEKHLKAELKRLDYPGKEFGVNAGQGATTNFLKNKRGETVAIVCLFDHSNSLTATLGLIVHEAVHVWQEVKEIIGEKSPSPEFEAYSIQAIAQELMMEYIRQTKRRQL